MLEGITSNPTQPLHLIVPSPYVVVPFTIATPTGNSFLYRTSAKLGRGSIGAVYQVYEKEGRQFKAINLVMKRQSVEDKLESTIRVSMTAAMSLPCDVVEFKTTFLRNELCTIMPKLYILNRSVTGSADWHAAAEYAGMTPDDVSASCMAWLVRTLQCVMSNQYAVISDFKVANMGFYRCNEGTLQWRIIDVDSIFGDLYTSTYPLLNWEALDMNTGLVEDATLSQVDPLSISPQMVLEQPSFDYYEPLGKLQTIHAIAATAIDLKFGIEDLSPLLHGKVFKYFPNRDETRDLLQERVQILQTYFQSATDTNFRLIMERGLEVNSRISSDKDGNMQVFDSDGGMWKIKKFQKNGRPFHQYAYEPPNPSPKRRRLSATTQVVDYTK